MEDEQLPGDELSPETSQLNPEIGREEGQGSWDELEREEEEEVDHSEEIESALSGEGSGVSLGADPSGEQGAPGQPGQPEEFDQEEEEEEMEQKNTLSDSSPRVLSFKDFFSNN